MVVLSALRRAVAALVRNPLVFVATALVALFQLPLLAAQALGPMASTVVSTVFNLVFLVVFPFVQGGFLGMAEEALDGRTSLGTFVDEGKANYVQMLIGYAVLFGVNLVIGMALLVVLLGGGGVVLLLAHDPTGIGVLPLALLGLLVLAAVLAYLLVAFFVQFYGQAIVVDDHEAIEAFKRSYRLVRANLLATTGYSLIVGALGGLFGLVVGGVSILLSAPLAEQGDMPVSVPTLSPAGQASAAAAVVVLTTLFTALFLVYSVAFYRAIRGEEDRADRAAPGPA